MNLPAEWSAKRKEVRAIVRPFAVANYVTSFSLVVIDIALFLSCSFAVAIATSVMWKFAASICLAFAICRLFVLGHDACHQSLTPSRQLNVLIGRIVFMPSMTCSSLWIAGHNLAHHAYTGLRGQDIPWVPLSPEDYLALPSAKRWLYRVYRSWYGAGLYYGVSIWLSRQYFPKGKVRRVFVWDSWLVTAFFAAQVVAYTWAAYATGQSPLLILILGIVLPFVIWLHVAGLVFYLHHTDLDARWYDDLDEWRRAQPNLAGTHVVHLPLRIDLLLHHAMDHSAHHVNVAVPCYNLANAQSALQRRWPDETETRVITWRKYVLITKACQLYDSRQHKWLTCDEVERRWIPLLHDVSV